MKKQRLDRFNKMVDQHKREALELCKMAGLDTQECGDFFVPPAKELTPPSSTRPNGSWLRKLWPF